MANKVLAETGVIGGTGLYAMQELKILKEIKVKTPFGNPSDSVILGTLSRVKVAFLPRHGRKHAILPGEINQCANMGALKSIGVKTIISVSAMGSLKQELYLKLYSFYSALRAPGKAGVAE